MACDYIFKAAPYTVLCTDCIKKIGLPAASASEVTT